MLDVLHPEGVTLEGEEREPSLLGEELLQGLLSSDGKPRLAPARDFLLDEVCRENLPVIMEAFKSWRDYVEYLLLMGRHVKTGKEQFVAVKCSKRGNDVFTRRLDYELGVLRELDGVELFTIDDFQTHEYMPCNLLFLTLTFDSKLCSMREAWQQSTYYWNLLLTNLRNKYGRVFYIQMPEAFPDENGEAYGYPHPHAILLFLDHQFHAFPRWERKKNGEEGWVYRIKEKHELEEQAKWHSFIDVKAINSGRSLGGYLRKHVKNTHGGDDPSALLTQAMLWLHRKRTYTMSEDFMECSSCGHTFSPRMLDPTRPDMKKKKYIPREKCPECSSPNFIRRGFREVLHESILNLRNSKPLKQVDFARQPVIEWIWTFHGVASAKDLGLSPDVWVASLSKLDFKRWITFGLPERL
jgi:hypothetical protein